MDKAIHIEGEILVPEDTDHEQFVKDLNRLLKNKGWMFLGYTKVMDGE